MDIETGVSYDDDLDKVIRVTMELLENNNRVLSEPKPKVAVRVNAERAYLEKSANSFVGESQLGDLHSKKCERFGDLLFKKRSC